MACLFIVIYAEIIFLRADFFFAIVLLFKQKFPFGGKVLNLNLESKSFRDFHEKCPEINLKS